MVTFQNWTKPFEMGVQLWSVTFSHYGRKFHNFVFFLISLYISLSRNKQIKTRSGSTSLNLFWSFSNPHMVKSIHKGSNLNIQKVVYLHQMLLLAFNNFHA